MPVFMSNQQEYPCSSTCTVRISPGEKISFVRCELRQKVPVGHPLYLLWFKNMYYEIGDKCEWGRVVIVAYSVCSSDASAKRLITFSESSI